MKDVIENHLMECLNCKRRSSDIMKIQIYTLVTEDICYTRKYSNMNQSDYDSGEEQFLCR